MADIESDLSDLSEPNPMSENRTTAVLDECITRCKYEHHIGSDGLSSFKKPVEKCTTCGQRKICGPFVGHVCLKCNPENGRPCLMCSKPLFDCTC